MRAFVRRVNVAPTSAAPLADLASLPAAGDSGLSSFPALLAQLAGLFSSLAADTSLSPVLPSTHSAGSSIEPKALPAPVSDPSLEPLAANPILVSPASSVKAIPAAVSIPFSAPLSRQLFSLPAVQASPWSPAGKIPGGQEPTGALPVPAQSTGGDSTTVPAASAPPPDAKSVQPASKSLAEAFLASLQPAPQSPSFPSGRGAELSKPADQAPAQPSDAQAPENSNQYPQVEQKAPPEPGEPSRTLNAKPAPAWLTVPFAPPRPVTPLSIEIGPPPVAGGAEAEQVVAGPRNADHRSGAGLTDPPQPISGNPQSPQMTAESTGFDLFWRTFGSSSALASSAMVSTGNHFPPVAPAPTPDAAGLAAAPAQDEPAVPPAQKPGVAENVSAPNETLAESGANGKSPAPIVPNAAPADQNQGGDQQSGRSAGHGNPEPSPHAPPAFVAGAGESNHASEIPAAGLAAEQTSSAPQSQPAAAEQTVTANPRATRELSLRLEQDNAPAVSLSLSERGGAVRVAVRTSDTELGSRLQSNLDQLMVSLRHQGVEAEAGKTAAMAAQRNQPGAGDQTPFDSQGRSGGNGSGNRHRPRRNRASHAAEETLNQFTLQIPDSNPFEGIKR